MKNDQPASFHFPIEASQLLAFCRAIGEVEDAGIVPPTFAMAADVFDPDFSRRPNRGEPWLDKPVASLFHVEQTFHYYERLKPGMQLLARRLPEKRWIKQGRKGGELTFIEVVTELLDNSGKLLLSSSWVDVKPEKTHASLTQGQVNEQRQADSHVESANTAVETITRTQMVMYVGAAGDFHPLHHDEAYAKSQGYPSVFAPGMLTMALNGKAITQRIGHNKMKSFGGRFRAQVWPGDRLCTELTSCNEKEQRIIATTRNQHDLTVFDGWADIEGKPANFL